MSRAKNILLLHCHDLGRFLPTYGIETVSAPHLDRLAENSVVFERAFATAPQCSPARSSLFTGDFPQHTGVMGLTHDPFAWDMRDPTRHIASRLGRKGYHTALFGVHHESHVVPDATLADRFGLDTVITDGHASVVAERAADELRKVASAGRPFYLQVGFWEPHRSSSPHDPPGVVGFLNTEVEPDARNGVTIPPFLHDDEDAAEEVAELQGAIAAMDRGVGAVLGTLDRLGLAESTIVVFTTDHGLAFPRAKCSLYDPGLEVTLFIRVPGRPDWAGREGGLVSHIDLVPTLLDLLGFDDNTCDGRSLVPIVEGSVQARDYVFGQLTHHTYFDPKRSVRSQRYKLIATFTNAPRAMDPSQSWRRRTMPHDVLTTMPPSDALEFYDLAEDPLESHNIVEDSECRDIIGLHAATLLNWMSTVSDPLLAAWSASPPRHQQVLARLRELSR